MRQLNLQYGNCVYVTRKLRKHEKEAKERAEAAEAAAAAATRANNPGKRHRCYGGSGHGSTYRHGYVCVAVGVAADFGISTVFAIEQNWWISWPCLPAVLILQVLSGTQLQIR